MRGKGLVLGAMGALLLFAAPASGASKNVKLLDTLPEAKDATAINFLEYDKKGWGWGKHKRDLDVMLVTGRFGLKSYSLEDPRHPELLDEVTAEELRLPGDPPVNSGGDPDAGAVSRSGRTRTWTSTASASSRCCRAIRAPTPARRAVSRVTRTRTTRPTSPASTSSTPRIRRT